MVVVTEGRTQPPETPGTDDTNPEQIKSHVANKKWYVDNHDQNTG